MRAHRVSASKIAIRCPACGSAHAVDLQPAGPWTFNSDFERPTFQPSLDVSTPRTANAGDIDLPPRKCHSIITDGRIQFLADSTHALAGQTVDLPEWEDAS